MYSDTIHINIAHFRPVEIDIFGNDGIAEIDGPWGNKTLGVDFCPNLEPVGI
ncbi:MAG: hypothetical protein JJ868_15595 [Shimia sp.]|uniref:hypothetical protein n=1 Tax=Shimia sp. TaxID=1954381 RepID=UPI0019E6BB7B|nr:hypothetical protein [Shimia sp.]MBE1292473.1 hypothetical protein [Paracoccaceae bacterium]MBO6898797.1 hypothetical protein [Shimia sp.]